MTRFYNFFRFTLLFLSISISSLNNSYAETADRNLPTQIDSDSMTVDDVNQISIFTGNVILTKGTILLKADKLELREDAKGYQIAIATSNSKRPVFLRQKREGLNEYIEATAKRMEYDGREDRFFLISNAIAKRSACGISQDEVRGQKIIYDQRTETYTAIGGPESPTHNQRVRAIIQPKNSTSNTPIQCPKN